MHFLLNVSLDLLYEFEFVNYLMFSKKIWLYFHRRGGVDERIRNIFAVIEILYLGKRCLKTKPERCQEFILNKP